jgi:flavin-dependent dehydrogenase
LRDPALDVELLELNKQILEENERKKKQEKILKILKEKQVIKTLYSVKNSKFVDKMISNYKNFEDVPSYLYTKY